MSKVLELNAISQDNIVFKSNELIKKQKRFAQVSTISDIYDVSRSTVYRWLNEIDKLGYENIYVELSASLKLINLDKLDQFLFDQHKKYL